MTMKFMEEGLRFGRTWVDRIMGKVDKDQGVANAGKVLGIGADGIVTPVEQSGGGGSTFPYAEEITNMSASELSSKLKIGDELQVELRYYKLGNVNIANPTLEAKGELTVINGTISYGESNGSYPVRLIVNDTDVYGYYTFSNPVVYESTSKLTSTVNDKTLNRIGHAVAIAERLTPSGLTTRSFVNASVFIDDPLIVPRLGYKVFVLDTNSFTGRIIHNS